MTDRKKILLIDHEPRITQLVREALHSVGNYLVREEHDTTIAVQVAQWFEPDLIMVDLTLAATDGEIIAQSLRQDARLRQTPLLCLSNFVTERQFLSAGILSGYSFLAAPVPMEQLLSAVEQLLC